jgi:hypothetical protein
MDGRVILWEIHNAWGLDGRKEDFGIVCNDTTAYYSMYGLPWIVGMGVVVRPESRFARLWIRLGNGRSGAEFAYICYLLSSIHLYN